MSLNLFLTFDVESNRPGNYITCEHVPGAPGLFWIMDELERHGARGVFFVNVYEHTRYADGWMQGILREIHDRGHEVGLHCHLNPDLEFYRRNLTLYDAEGQTRIIRYGADLIESATGQPVAAFRSGALRVNNDTFIALRECGIKVDSSLMYSRNKNNHNEVDQYLSVNQPTRYGEVLECPITVVDRGHGHRARLDPNSTPDARGLISAIEQMMAAGCRHAVFLAHSFSFVLCTGDPAAALPGTTVFKKNKQPPNYVTGQDLYTKSVFTEFLQFLQAEKARVETALFRDAAAADAGALAGDGDFVPRVPFNGLWSWPGVEDYAKHDKSDARSSMPAYRTRPRRLVLHVGTWKTGSKALQKFWAQNREELEKRGIFYPLTLNAPYMKGGNRSYQSLIATSGDGERVTRLQALGKEIGVGEGDTALVSHENICNLSRPELLEFLSSLSGSTFKIVLYLRRQDHYAESLYNQHVKAGVAFAGTFDEHFERYRERYDYRRMIEKLGDVFGSDNIVVRPYERGQFFGGTIFADFMRQAFELEDLADFALPERDQNSRLDRDALEFKRTINGLDGPKEQKLQIGKHLIKYCEKVDPRIKEAFQVHGLLAPQQRVELLRSFADSNAWVARECLGRADGELFLEPWPGADDPWAPYPGLTANRATELAFHVCQSMEAEAQEREAKRLKAERREQQQGDSSKYGERQAAGVRRAVKHFCKRQLRQGRALVSRLRPSPKPKPGIFG